MTHTRIPKLVALISLCCSTLLLSASVIYTENFDYPVGNLEGQGRETNVWTLSSYSDYNGFESPLVVDEDLQYPCYGGCIVAGKSAKISTKEAASPEVQRYTYLPFKSTNTGTVYAAFVLKVDEAISSDRDFIAFEGGTGTMQRGRLFVRRVSSTEFKLGITHNTSKPASEADWITGLKIADNHIVVIKYEFVAGEKNDVVSVFVDFPLNESESSAAVIGQMKSNVNANSATDFSSLKGLTIKQRSNQGTLKIGHIRVATTWEEAIDYQLPGVLIDENFDNDKPGSPWVYGGNVETSTNTHGAGTGKSLKFTYVESANVFTVTTLAVNTADELSFWMKKNSTRAQVESVVVEKVVGSEPAEVLATYQNSDIPSNEWKEFVIPVYELRSNVKFVITVTMNAPTSEGTPPFLMLDDMHLNSLEAVEIWDNQDNTAVLTANKSKNDAPKSVNVLMHRNLVGGTFNTICLPFKLATTAEIQSYFGESVVLKRLNRVEERTDGGFDLTFANATTMAAGQPFLIQPAEDITTPILFRDVQITKTSNADVTGNYQPTGTAVVM